MSALRPLGSRVVERGAGLVETMIGIVIGLLVVLVIYNLLAAAENFKRMSIGASDAQITGLLSQFMLGRDAGNGGNGVIIAATKSIQSPGLADCTKDENDNLLNLLPLDDPRTAVRPIPLIVTDSGSKAVSDSMITMVSASPHVLWGVGFAPAAGVGSFPPGSDFTVQSPNGFSSPIPAVTPYLVIVMDGAGTCTLTTVTGASTPPTTEGAVTLTHGPPIGGVPWKKTYTVGTAGLVNLGPRGLAARTRYDVSKSQLRTTDLLTEGAAPNPVAQNVVLMKVHYGVDTNSDDIIDCWTPADNKTCGDFSEAAVRAMTVAQLNRILAVRIGVVVRSDEPDLKDDTLKAGGATPRQPVILFNCSADTDAACPNRIIVPAGAAASLSNPDCAPAVICDHWRYRTYEAVVPLRNVIFNATLPP